MYPSAAPLQSVTVPVTTYTAPPQLNLKKHPLTGPGHAWPDRDGHGHAKADRDGPDLFFCLGRYSDRAAHLAMCGPVHVSRLRLGSEVAGMLSGRLFLIVAFNQRLEEVSHVLLGDYGNAGVNVLLTEILALHGVNGSLNALIAHDLRVLSHNGA